MNPASLSPGADRPKATLIFEYPPSDDWMARTLVDALQAGKPGLRLTGIHGIFATYRPGGLRPQRILNLLWVYLRTAVHLAFRHPDCVIVRSSPPGIQVWTQWWARLKGIPVVCWLMDYHPEMEARALDRRGWRKLANWLRRVDADAMRRFALVVTLDRAMAKVAQSRAGAVTVAEHPTWGNLAEVAEGSPAAPRTEDGVLRLAYSGNLGAAHDLAVATRFLAACARRVPVELYVIGASAAGIARFHDVARETGITVTPHDRVPFSQLAELYRRWAIAAGIVLLAEESAGLVSPSKFSGYIDFGLPIIYVGPTDTNTAEVCTSFLAGIRLSNQAVAAEVEQAVDRILDPAYLKDAAKGAKQASKYFRGFNQESLAAIIIPYLKANTAR